MKERITTARLSTVALIAVLSTAFAAPLAGQGGNFGTATATSGADIWVGQPANFYGPGVAYVYRSDSEDNWAEVDRIFAPDSALGDLFGRSIAGATDRVLIGAPGRAQRGGLYLLERSATGGDWSITSSTQASLADEGAEFGAAVVLEDGLAFVGAPGAGLVYQVNIADNGLQIESILEPRDLEDARFGEVLSLEGDRLLVGAPQADGGKGAAVVFRRDGSGDWAEEAVLTFESASEETESRFGTAVHLEGGRAFVGAPRAARSGGAVLVFASEGGEWSMTEQLVAQDSEPGSGFGVALGGAGGVLWVGAPNAGGDLSGRGDGAVYRFEARGGAGWTQIDRIVPDSANTAAWQFGFGSSVAAGTEVAVVGMPTRDFGEGRAAILTPSGSGEWAERATVFGEIATAVSQIETGSNCDEGSVEVFQCNNIEVVSFTPVSVLGGPRGVWVNDVWGWTDSETGRDYALVSRRDGAAFVDLTDPAQPRLIGSLPRTSGSRPSVWRDIKVYSDHAYIVSDGAGAHGMQVFDLTRLRSVTDAPVTFDTDAHYNRIFSAHNVVADTASGFLYVVGSNSGGETCGGGLHMVDVREPKNPVFAGCYNDPTGARARGYTHDAQCVTYNGPDTRYVGREICVGANEVEINIADVTDKDRPVPIGRSGYPNAAYAHQGWFDESQRYFYMGDEGDEVAGSVDGTRTLIWDLAELDDPQLVSTYIAPVRATDHNLFIKGDRVFMSNYGSGLRVLDITDPENPYEMAFFDSAPKGDNDAGTSSSQSGAWSNYPFFESGLVVFTSVREGLFVVRVKPRSLIP